MTTTSPAATKPSRTNPPSPMYLAAVRATATGPTQTAPNRKNEVRVLAREPKASATHWLTPLSPGKRTLRLPNTDAKSAPTTVMTTQAGRAQFPSSS
ncbi:hypothetical protein DSECCO2_418300 [anaerobic digester metagenome]